MVGFMYKNILFHARNDRRSYIAANTTIEKRYPFAGESGYVKQIYIMLVATTLGNAVPDKAHFFLIAKKRNHFFLGNRLVEHDNTGHDNKYVKNMHSHGPAVSR